MSRAFRKSKVDDKGLLLERRAAVVVTMPNDPSINFGVLMVKSLRQLADLIETEHASVDAQENHTFLFGEADQATPAIDVDVVSLDGVDRSVADDQPSEIDMSVAARTLTSEELAEIS